jgi:hypothetical protein
MKDIGGIESVLRSTNVIRFEAEKYYFLDRKDWKERVI